MVAFAFLMHEADYTFSPAAKSSDDHADPQLDTPEANAAKNTVRLCRIQPGSREEAILMLHSGYFVNPGHQTAGYVH
jgi:hypothetical protein